MFDDDYRLEDYTGHRETDELDDIRPRVWCKSVIGKSRKAESRQRQNE